MKYKSLLITGNSGNLNYFASEYRVLKFTYLYPMSKGRKFRSLKDYVCYTFVIFEKQSKVGVFKYYYPPDFRYKRVRNVL